MYVCVSGCGKGALTLVWKQKMVTEMDTIAVMIMAMMTALVLCMLGGQAEASAPSDPPLSAPAHPTPVHSQYLDMVPVIKPMASVCKKDKLT